jgi:hypothetical protein
MNSFLVWITIDVLCLLILSLWKTVRDLEDQMAGMEQRFNRRLTYLEENQRHK